MPATRRLALCVLGLGLCWSLGWALLGCASPRQPGQIRSLDAASSTATPGLNPAVDIIVRAPISAQGAAGVDPYVLVDDNLVVDIGDPTGLTSVSWHNKGGSSRFEPYGVDLATASAQTSMTVKPVFESGESLEIRAEAESPYKPDTLTDCVTIAVHEPITLSLLLKPSKTTTWPPEVPVVYGIGCQHSPFARPVAFLEGETGYITVGQPLTLTGLVEGRYDFELWMSNSVPGSRACASVPVFLHWAEDEARRVFYANWKALDPVGATMFLHVEDDQINSASLPYTITLVSQKQAGVRISSTSTATDASLSGLWRFEGIPFGAPFLAEVRYPPCCEPDTARISKTLVAKNSVVTQRISLPETICGHEISLRLDHPTCRDLPDYDIELLPLGQSPYGVAVKGNQLGSIVVFDSVACGQYELNVSDPYGEARPITHTLSVDEDGSCSLLTVLLPDELSCEPVGYITVCLEGGGDSRWYPHSVSYTGAQEGKSTFDSSGCHSLGVHLDVPLSATLNLADSCTCEGDYPEGLLLIATPDKPYNQGSFDLSGVDCTQVPTATLCVGFSSQDVGFLHDLDVSVRRPGSDMSPIPLGLIGGAFEASLPSGWWEVQFSPKGSGRLLGRATSRLLSTEDIQVSSFRLSDLGLYPTSHDVELRLVGGMASWGDALEISILTSQNETLGTQPFSSGIARFDDLREQTILLRLDLSLTRDQTLQLLSPRDRALPQSLPIELDFEDFRSDQVLPAPRLLLPEVLHIAQHPAEKKGYVSTVNPGFRWSWDAGRKLRPDQAFLLTIMDASRQPLLFFWHTGEPDNERAEYLATPGDLTPYVGDHPDQAKLFWRVDVVEYRNVIGIPGWVIVSRDGEVRPAITSWTD